MRSTVEQDHPGLDGRTILIAGATSGIGYAATVAMARRGAAVHFLARDHGRAERARRGIAAASGSASISYGLADLEDLDAVRARARDFCATHDRLECLSTTLAPPTSSSADTGFCEG